MQGRENPGGIPAPGDSYSHSGSKLQILLSSDNIYLLVSKFFRCRNLTVSSAGRRRPWIAETGKPRLRCRSRHQLPGILQVALTDLGGAEFAIQEVDVALTATRAEHDRLSLQVFSARLDYRRMCDSKKRERRVDSLLSLPTARTPSSHIATCVRDLSPCAHGDSAAVQTRTQQLS